LLANFSGLPTAGAKIPAEENKNTAPATLSANAEIDPGCCFFLLRARGHLFISSCFAFLLVLVSPTILQAETENWSDILPLFSLGAF